MYRPSLLAGALLLISMAALAQQAPDISGRWKLDRDLTTEDLRWNRTTGLFIRQSDEQVRITYLDGERPIGTDVFTTDWEERPRYVTRIERAYARAKWDNNGLVIHTRSFLDIFGYQSYNMDDRWELSPDRQTLTDRSSDGKVMVFYRVKSVGSATAPH